MIFERYQDLFDYHGKHSTNNNEEKTIDINFNVPTGSRKKAYFHRIFISKSCISGNTDILSDLTPKGLL